MGTFFWKVNFYVTFGCWIIKEEGFFFFCWGGGRLLFCAALLRTSNSMCTLPWLLLSNSALPFLCIWQHRNNTQQRSIGEHFSSSSYIHPEKLVQRETRGEKSGFLSFRKRVASLRWSTKKTHPGWMQNMCTHRRVYTVRKVRRGTAMTYLQAVFWQDMKRGEHKKVIMRKETKRIGSFFSFFSPPFCVGEKSLLESTSVLVFA